MDVRIVAVEIPFSDMVVLLCKWLAAVLLVGAGAGVVGGIFYLIFGGA